MNNTYYEFREAESIEELRELFHLRHRVYSSSRLKDFCTDTEDEMDLNCYDLKSLHFGLFRIDETGKSTAVGYHRIVQDTDGPMKSEVLMIASEYPEVLDRVMQNPPAPLPMISYYSEPEILQSFYNDVKAKGMVIKEATKFSVDTSICNDRSLAQHIIEAEIAIHFIVHGVDYGIMACTLLHSRFYRRFGYYPMEGTKMFNLVGNDGFVVIASQESVHTILTERIKNMAVAYLQTGRICYNPSEPENYYAPLGSYRESKPVFIAA